MNNVPKNNDCPARMADGRHFTDYRPNCYLNNLIRIQNNIFSNFHYREFMSQNGEKLIQMNRVNAVEKNGCKSCSTNGTPYEYLVRDSETVPAPNGAASKFAPF